MKINTRQSRQRFQRRKEKSTSEASGLGCKHVGIESYMLSARHKIRASCDSFLV